MSIKLRVADGSFSYAEITDHCKQQIMQLAAEAARHSGLEAQHRKERAYGVYMGWRTLVMQRAVDKEFARDDRLLEAMVARLLHKAHE